MPSPSQSEEQQIFCKFQTIPEIIIWNHFRRIRFMFLRDWDNN